MQFLKVTYERPSQAGEDHFIVREHGMYEERRREGGGGGGRREGGREGGERGGRREGGGRSVCGVYSLLANSNMASTSVQIIQHISAPLQHEAVNHTLCH